MDGHWHCIEVMFMWLINQSVILMVGNAMWSEFITISETVAVVLYFSMHFAVMFINFVLLFNDYSRRIVGGIPSEILNPPQKSAAWEF